MHGHKGPWLVIGYRAGEVAVRILKPKTEFDLRCVIRTPLKTPYTCAVDGIQVATKCTLGKLSIELKESDEVAYEFKNERTGETLKLKPKKHIVEKLEEFKGFDKIHEAAKWVESLEEEEIFELS